MNNQVKLASIVALMMISASASATGKLSMSDCHSYPFVPVKGEVTHADLIRDRSELESVGYQPSKSDPEYPRDLARAEKALHTKFVSDCGMARKAYNTKSIDGVL